MTDKIKQKLNLPFGIGDTFYSISCGNIKEDIVLWYSINVSEDRTFTQHIAGNVFSKGSGECAPDPDLLMHQILTNYKKSILEDLE